MNDADLVKAIKIQKQIKEIEKIINDYSADISLYKRGGQPRTFRKVLIEVGLGGIFKNLYKEKLVELKKEFKEM